MFTGITLPAILVQDPIRSRLLSDQKTTNMNDYFSVLTRLDRKVFQSACAIIFQNKGGYEIRKSYVPTALKINASIKKNHWMSDIKDKN